MKTYPLFLTHLDRLRIVVAGGDRAAAAKLEGLLAAGAARIELYAPAPCPELLALIDGRRVRHEARRARAGDLDGAALAIATEIDHQHNAELAAGAAARGVLFNARDDPPHCTWIAPATIQRGELTVAIGTGGAAPALAVRLREELEQWLARELGDFVALARRLRPLVRRRLDAFDARRDYWYRLVDSDVRALLAQGRLARAWQRAIELLEAA